MVGQSTKGVFYELCIFFLLIIHCKIPGKYISEESLNEISEYTL